MKRALKILVLLAVLGGGALGVYGMYHLVQQRRQQGKAAEERGPLKVAAVRVRKADLVRKAAVTGEIKALQVVDVVPKVTGCLQRLRLPDGTLLEEGTVIQPQAPASKLPVIAVIEHEALDAALGQAEAAERVADAAVVTARAAVGAAEAAVRAARVALADRQREKQRTENLLKDGSSTQKQWDAAVATCDQAAAQRDGAQAQLAAAQARVAEAEAGRAKARAAVRQARVTLDDATLTAPIAGVVIRRHVDEGNMVGPTTPLVRIARIETVKIRGGISERHLQKLQPGVTEAAVALDAVPGQQFLGKVHLVGQAVDPATRTVDVEIRVANPDGTLKPGMFARVTLVLERRAGVAVVPDSALLRDDSGPYVYAVHEGRARRRRLTLGLSEGVFHEVRAGLETGDLIVVRGQRLLRDGQAVHAVEEDQP
jgi:multidrug efflux pump subunit AcrA (membrane-fusion protein)